MGHGPDYHCKGRKAGYNDHVQSISHEEKPLDRIPGVSSLIPVYFRTPEGYRAGVLPDLNITPKPAKELTTDVFDITIEVFGENQDIAMLYDTCNGNKYRIVKIQGRWRMAENIRYGTLIPYLGNTKTKGVPS